MKKQIALALLCLCVMVTSAQAHHHRHHVKSHYRVFKGGFIDANNGCAINTSNWLEAHGIHIKLTWSSHDFIRYHQISRSEARFGDVAHTWRKGGGHIQPVIEHVGNVVTCLNPSHHHHQWIKKVCPANATFHRIS